MTCSIHDPETWNMQKDRGDDPSCQKKKMAFNNLL